MSSINDLQLIHTRNKIQKDVIEQMYLLGITLQVTNALYLTLC